MEVFTAACEVIIDSFLLCFFALSNPQRTCVIFINGGLKKNVFKKK